LITAHQAFLKRAELHPEYDGMESGVVVERGGEIVDIQGDFTSAGDKLLGGWARVFFHTRSHPMYKRIRLERFKKPFGIWLDDPAGMICKCAEADALRSSFPTMLGGLYLREEVDNGKPAILEPKIPMHVKDMAFEATVGGDSKQPTEDTPLEKSAPPAAQPPPTPSPAPPPTPASVKRKKKVLEVKKKDDSPSKEIGPNRAALRERLKVGGFSEEQFLAIANKNEWLGKGRTWDSLDQLNNDDMLEVFLRDEEWTTVQEELEKTVAYI
jgi:hypothetical protein